MEDIINESNVLVELAGDDIVSSDEEELEPTAAEIIARKEKLLIKAHSSILRSCWGSSSCATKTLKAVWSFFVKATDDDASSIIKRLGKGKPGRTAVESGKQVGEAKTCFHCYSWDHDELHPSIHVEHPCLIDSGLFGDENIAELFHEEPLSNSRRYGISSTFLYKSSSSQLLRQHVLRHHPHELRIIETDMFPNGVGSNFGTDEGDGGSHASGSDRIPIHGDIRNQFKSTKRISMDDPKQKMFYTLVSLLLVFAKFPFHFVENAWFNFLVWFLDPSYLIPTRKQLTKKNLPELYKRASAAGRAALFERCTWLRSLLWHLDESQRPRHYVVGCSLHR